MGCRGGEITAALSADDVDGFPNELSGCMDAGFRQSGKVDSFDEPRGWIPSQQIDVAESGVGIIASQAEHTVVSGFG